MWTRVKCACSHVRSGTEPICWLVSVDFHFHCKCNQKSKSTVIYRVNVSCIIQFTLIYHLKSSCLLWWCCATCTIDWAHPTPFSQMYSQLSMLTSSSTSSLLLFLLELDTVKSGQNRRSDTASNRFLARVWLLSELPSGLVIMLVLDQNKLFHSGSSKMYGIILVSNLLAFMTVWWSAALLQLLSTASWNFSTNYKH